MFHVNNCEIKKTGTDATMDAINIWTNWREGRMSAILLFDSFAMSTKNTIILIILHSSEAMDMYNGELKHFTQRNSNAISASVKYIVTFEYILVFPIDISKGANGTI